MIRLLRKELRQGWWLPPFGLLLALAVVALHAIFGQLAWTLKDADEFCAGVLGVAPIFLAIFTAAGIFTREKAAGTLPHLLGLPLSRDVIWSTKVLAGLLLFAATWACLVFPAVLLLPHLRATIHLQTFALETLVWSVAGFSLTILASTLSERTMGSLLAGLGLTFGLFCAVGYLTAEVGIGLTGWDSDQVLDIGLWGWIGIAAGLLGSWLAFRKGELLQRRRKWIFGVTTCALVLLSAFWLTIGLARWETRYRRTAVERILRPTLIAGRAVSFYALCYPTWREHSATGWRRAKAPRYRGSNAVLIDAEIGRGLFSSESPSMMSPKSISGAEAAGMNWHSPPTAATSPSPSSPLPLPGVKRCMALPALSKFGISNATASSTTACLRPNRPSSGR